jgi:hypothetical protein
MTVCCCIGDAANSVRPLVRTAHCGLWATAGRRAVHRILYIALYLLTDSAMLLATVAAGLYEY